jgi:hypothetical protein
VTTPDSARAPLTSVARVLRAAGRDAARVAEPARLKSWARNDVWRVRIEGGAGEPSSVIVKRFKSEPARGLDAVERRA